MSVVGGVWWRSLRIRRIDFVRILLSGHLTATDPQGGGQLARLAEGLVRAGHELQGVVAGARDDVAPAVRWRRVVFDADDPAADLDFALPRFGPSEQSGPSFDKLTERQLARYRETMRRAMDTAISEFNPHVIHCQRAWLLGHLALETGVPYVITVWEPELELSHDDGRYSRFVCETVENAGRILAADRMVARRLVEICPDAAGRIVPMPDLGAPGAIDSVLAAYRAALDARFGGGMSA